MNILSILGTVTAITNFGISIFVLFRLKNSTHVRVFAAIALASGVWGLAGAVFSTIPKESHDLAMFWWQVGYTGAILTVPFFLHFIASYLKLDNQKNVIRIVYFLSFLFLFFNWFDRSSLFIGDLQFVFGKFYWGDWFKRRGVIWLIFYIGFYWIILGYSFILLVRGYLKSTGMLRNQLKYFMLGSIIGWLGAEFQYLPTLRIYIFPYSMLLIGVYPAIWAYAIIKYHLMDIRVAITRAGIFLTIYTIVIGLPLWFTYQFGGHFWAVLSMAILALAGPFIYDHLRQRVERILLRRQMEHQLAIREFAEALTKIKQLNMIFSKIKLKMEEIVGPEFIGIYTFSRTTNAYTLKEEHSTADYKLNRVIKKDSSLARVFNELRQPIFSELCDDKCLGDAAHETMIIPFYAEGSLFGFIVLGPKMENNPYTLDIYVQQDVGIFEILSSQISLAVENCLFWRSEKIRAMKEEQIRRQKAMDHFSASLAHEVDNPIFTVQCTAELLKETLVEECSQHLQQEKLTPLTGELDNIITSIKRISRIVKSVREFSAQTDGEFTEISMNDVAYSFTSILGPQAKYDGIIFEKHIESDIFVNGNKIHLVEIFMNLAVNALHAVKNHTGNDKKIIFSIAKTDKDKCLISLADDGYGIDEDLAGDIFLDFVTTKPPTEGSGMGLPRVKNMVEKHGGKIWFESKGKGKGTTFFIELPLLN
ncbi:MAG: GHKL domain-containing protein [Candidatus Omnitrophica bacterium]|nr:GHKL domain-containing protein [Candidatus Omnitrophota bacterium]